LDARLETKLIAGFSVRTVGDRIMLGQIKCLSCPELFDKVTAPSDNRSKKIIFFLLFFLVGVCTSVMWHFVVAEGMCNWYLRNINILCLLKHKPECWNKHKPECDLLNSLNRRL
jgi:hypothetical protein